MIWQFLYQVANAIRHAYWFVFHPDTFGVKVVIESNDGKYLFVRHGYGGKRWTFPGGGIKRHETPSDAARREVKEELRVELYDLAPVGTFVSDWEGKHDTVHCYHARIAPGARILPRRGEILAYGWFPKSDLPSGMSLSATEALKLIGD